ncbi:MAG: serine hydrolase domain-containing protein [Methanocorpusculum sp.]|nr:serine hydrolase domain-containing protein [Methanocorpusculum sp.]
MYKKRIARIDDSICENADTYFEIASLSKTLYAYCVIALAKEGIINLDQPLSEYAPKCSVSTDKRAQRITARHILYHASGLMNWEDQSDKTICFEPGQAFQYSGEGYFYLQQCIQSITALSFQNLLDCYINLPLGTGMASRFENIPVGKQFADPCEGDEAYDPIRQENAAYSVYATARDYAAFLRMIFVDGASAAMAESFVPVNADVRWCLGFGLLKERYAFQYGDNGDYQALYYVDIPTRRVWLRLSNSQYGLMEATQEIDCSEVRSGITSFLKLQYGEDYACLTEHSAM